jgi:hypothetical protein
MNNNTASRRHVWTAAMFLMGIAGGIGVAKYLPPLGERSTPTRITAAKPIEQTDSAPATQFTAIETKVPEPDPTADRAAYQELQTLRNEMSVLNSAQHPAADYRSAPVPNDPTLQSHIQPAAPAAPTESTGEKTLAYWNGMNAIMEHEGAMRAAPPKITADNALSFVSGETAAYQHAADAIRKLNREGVDADVISLAREIVAWYNQGIANTHAAESLLQSADIASRQGQPGQDWQSAEKQHREQCLQINLRGEQLRESLSRKYGVAFPKLQ